MFSSETGAGVAFFQTVPLCVSLVLSDDVWKHRSSDLSCLWRSEVVERGCKAVLDVSRSLGLGVYGRRDVGLDRGV